MISCYLTFFENFLYSSFNNSKSFSYNQRLVLKINSKRLRYNNWDLNVSLEEAKKNEELVSLGDSIVLRMIRQIRGNSVTEDDINQTKRNIKK